MSAPFLNGMSPRDPFQGARTTGATSILALARQWDDLTRQIDDNDAYRQAELAAPPFGGDERVDRLWREREGIAAKILAHADPTIAGIAAKLRMLAWHMNVEHGECANHDGVRTNELEPDEKIIANALADAERLAGRVDPFPV
jgi:hypothetical protein